MCASSDLLRCGGRFRLLPTWIRPSKASKERSNHSDDRRRGFVMQRGCWEKNAGLPYGDAFDDHGEFPRCLSFQLRTPRNDRVLSPLALEQLPGETLPPHWTPNRAPRGVTSSFTNRRTMFFQLGPRGLRSPFRLDLLVRRLVQLRQLQVPSAPHRRSSVEGSGAR